MRTKIYRFLVNRVPDIEVRYHDIRRKNSGIMGRIYSWCALISMNISWAFGKGSIQNSSKNLFLLLEEMEKAEPADGELIKTLQKKLKKIDTRTILDDIGMAEMPLIIYLLYLKYNGDISLLPLGEHDMAIEADGISVANMSYLAVYIHLIEVRPNIIHLEGNVSIPSVFAERCRFVILNNDKEVSCRMEDYGLDLAKGGHVYEKRTAFIADIPLQAGDNNLVFANEIDGITCYYGKINAMRFSPLADCIPGQYCVRQGRILYIDQNVLKCIPSNPETLARFEKTFAEEIRKRIPEKSDWIIGLRNEAYSEKAPKPIWLFMDRVDRADDNAEALFRYVRQIKEIDSYFIIDGESSDYYRLKELGNVVKLYSDRHFRLLLKADYIISSQSNGAVENPFWDDAEYFRDLYHRAKIIFLQHGVIKDDMSPTLSRFNTNFRGFVTSTYKEWESILKYPYHYTKKKYGLRDFLALIIYIIILRTTS